LAERGEVPASVREAVLRDMRQHFRPEFINRVDEIVVFKPLSREEIEGIVDLMTEDLRRRLADRRITLEMKPEARALIAERGYDPVYGARPLKRFLQREVETRIGRELIAGEIPDGSTVVVDVKDGALVVAKA
jgi:ATP-dependent Clp protease ATP-binding subunit ClpB